MKNVVGLDTTFLADLLRRNEAALRVLRELSQTSQRHVTTSLNACELYQGAGASKQRSKSLAEVGEILEGLVVLPMDREASRLYGTLAADLGERGNPVPFLDLMIAGNWLAS